MLVAAVGDLRRDDEDGVGFPLQLLMLLPLVALERVVSFGTAGAAFLFFGGMGLLLDMPRSREAGQEREGKVQPYTAVWSVVVDSTRPNCEQRMQQVIRRCSQLPHVAGAPSNGSSAIPIQSPPSRCSLCCCIAQRHVSCNPPCCL